MTAGAGRALIRVNQGGLSPSGPRIYFRDIPALAGPGTGTGLRGGPGRCLLDAAALVDDAVQFADLGFPASDIEHQFGDFAMEFPGLDFHRFHALLAPGQRSEEHTSELQSLMRTSYAVFCLKQKKDSTNN